MGRGILTTAIVAAVLFGVSAPAHSWFQICNKSTERASVAVGYKHPDYDWTSEGWWSLGIGECHKVITGDLHERYYYVYATGSKRGVWQGRKSQEGGAFCTTSVKFTIHNRDYARNNILNCEKARFQTKKFVVVDTEDEENFTFNLRD